MRITILFLFFAFAASAQNDFDWQQYENELTRLGQNCIRLKTEEQRLAAADSFAVLLDEKIYDSETFSYPFTKVTAN